MNNKSIIAIFLAFALIITAGAAVLAQDDNSEPSLDVGTDAVETQDDTTGDDTSDEQDITQETEEPAAETSDYDTVEGYIDYLERNEEIDSGDKAVLKLRLGDYEENLELDTITSVVDRYTNEELGLGQSLVILNNLDEAVSNGLLDYSEEVEALEEDEDTGDNDATDSEEDVTNLVSDEDIKSLNEFIASEEDGQLLFQAALELRKLTRVDEDGEYTSDFINALSSGELSDDKELAEAADSLESVDSISELKKLSSKLRKDARDKGRDKNSQDMEAFQESETESNANENALLNRNKNKDKSNNGNKGGKSDKSNKSNGKAKGKDK